MERSRVEPRSRYRIPSCLLLVLVGIAVYSSNLDGPFLFDDHDAILGNRHIRALWPPWEAMSAPPQTAVSSRPVISFSLALNHAFGGLDVRGYRIVNLAVHVLCACLLFAIIRRTLQRPTLPPRLGRASHPLALSSALLWLVHPLQTECINYVVQRTESIMALLYLLTLYCVIRGTGSDRARWWYGASGIACALGMASKEVMVTAPLMVLLHQTAFESGSFARELRQRWGLYAGLAATWGVLAILMAGGARSESVGFGHGISVLDYALNQAVLIVDYLGLVFWPHPLVFDYGPAGPVAIREAAPSLLVLLVLAAATVVAYRRRPELGFLGVGFFVLLAPSSSFLPIATEVGAERRMYLPLATIILLVVVGGYALAGDLTQRVRWLRFSPWVAGGLVAGLAITLAWTTVRRNQQYRTAVSIWSTAVAVRPENARAHYSLGTALYNDGEIEEALKHYRRALEIAPSSALVHYNLGNALRAKGELGEAVDAYRQALALNPEMAVAHNNLGMVLRSRGQLEEAVAEYRHALRIDPEFPRAHNNLGVALQSQGRLEEAVHHYRRAFEIEPSYAAAHSNLGAALSRIGQPEQALFHFREALRLDPDQPLVLIRASRILGGHPDPRVRDVDEAIRLAERAAHLTSRQNVKILVALAATYATGHRYAAAARVREEALQLALATGDEHAAQAIRLRLQRYE
jgi:tetratricopeptide (TPR) repeat protein